MSSRVSFAARLSLLLLAAYTFPGLGSASARAADSDASASRPVGRWKDASIEDYRNHLAALHALTHACAKARNVTSCDPTLVGLDDRVPLGASAGTERRIVRYGWLRILFSRAEEPDKARKPPDTRESMGHANPPDKGEPVQPTTSQLLEEAQIRLQNDLEQVRGVPAEPPARSQEREVMKQVLAGREFRDLKQPTAGDTMLERFGNWLNRLSAKMDKLRARSVWIGRALIWGFFLTVGIALAVGLMRIERRWRVRLVPSNDRPAPDAASARDWQMWMGDARKAAAAGLFREAIHFVYWATISRLESKRLWPADRARTPREYLALVAAEDTRRKSLASLTRSFERTWYGGREAGEEDYRAAETLAAELISGGGRSISSGAPAPSVTVEGGVA